MDWFSFGFGMIAGAIVTAASFFLLAAVVVAGDRDES